MSGKDTEGKVYQPLEELNPAVSVYQRYIESGRVVRVGTRTSLGKYLKDTWDRRFYIFADAQAKARTQNNQHRLGMWWNVLKPSADAVFFWLLFAVILQTSRGMENYTAFIIIGVLMFQYFATALNSNAAVMRSNRGMIKSFSFPRISIPLSAAVKSAMNQMPVMLVILVAIIVIPPHAFPALTWILLVPLFVLAFVFNLGVGLIVARYAYVFPDLQNIISLLTRFLMYGSGVMFPIEQFVNHPTVTAIITANPIYQFLTLMRAVLIDGSWGQPMMWLSVVAWSVGVLVVGFFIFWRAEESFGHERN